MDVEEIDVRNSVANEGMDNGDHALPVIGFLILINYVASIVQGLTAFGDAIVLHILWHAAASVTDDYLHRTALGDNDVKIITVLMYSRTIVLNLVMVLLSIRSGATFVPKQLLALACIPSVVMSYVGESLLEYLPKETLTQYFGIACLSFAVAYAVVKVVKWNQQRQLPPTESLTTVAVTDDSGPDYMSVKVQLATGLASACAGLAGGLTGVGGPPWMILILAFELPAAHVRLLFPLSSLPSVYSRYVLAVRGGLITRDILPFHGAGVIFGFLGVLTGNYFGKRVGPKTFNAVVLTLLSLAALMMLIRQSPAFMMGLLFCSVTAIVVIWRQEQAELRALDVDKCGAIQEEGEEVTDGDLEMFETASVPSNSTRHSTECHRIYDQLPDHELFLFSY